MHEISEKARDEIQNSSRGADVRHKGSGAL